VEPNRDDDNHLPLAENLDRLKSARNLDGQPYSVIGLPMPAPVVFEGQRLPASYGNFYVANNLVLVPTFNDPNDRKALSILAELFPSHEVTGIHCGDHLGAGRAALHDSAAACIALITGVCELHHSARIRLMRGELERYLRLYFGEKLDAPAQQDRHDGECDLVDKTVFKK
jgi:hypothetical protein